MASTQVVDLTDDASPTVTKAQALPVAHTAKSTEEKTTSAGVVNTSPSIGLKKEEKVNNEQNGVGNQAVGTADVKPTTSAEWAEDDFTSALSRLQELHEQINALRSSIPEMLNTMIAPHETPQSLYSSFATLARTSSDGVRSLRNAWESEKMQGTLKRAESSRDKVSKVKTDEIPSLGIFDEWEVISWDDDKNPGSVDVKAVEDDWDMDSEHEPDTSREALSRIIDEFTAQHPDVKVSVDEDARSMLVVVPVPKRPLQFTIQQTDGEHGTQFTVSCQGSSRLCASITRSLKINPFKNDLAYILDLIASYATLQTAKCVVCHTLLNNHAMLPVVRKLKTVKDAETGDVSKTWVALHDDPACINY